MELKYLPVIGLEVHIEPGVTTKMFCGCPADHFGKKPNTQVCPICLGLPGALPFANWEGVEAVIKLGLAMRSRINNFSRFYRKNYFYPDLPKGFQTSQLDGPFCLGGELFGKRINHIHLEEDAGKLVHETVEGKKVSLIDFNRSGVALIEMVTEPDFNDTDEVIPFLKEVQLVCRYLGISNADMEKGSMRLEANVSVRRFDDTRLPGYKVELKNINSYKFLEKAVKAEIVRQTALLEKGITPDQETRGYDEAKQVTYLQRSKADAHDYRYFPEADLAPVVIDQETIDKLKTSLPELPNLKREKFRKMEISENYIEILVADKNRTEYFEKAMQLAKEHNISVSAVVGVMVNQNMDKTYPEPAGLIKKLVELTKVTFASSDEVEKAVKSVLMEQEKAVNDYKNGNGNVIGFLIGQTQKKLQGKGNPKIVQEKIVEELRK